MQLGYTIEFDHWQQLTVKEIDQLLLAHKLVVVKNCHLTGEELISQGKALGKLVIPQKQNQFHKLPEILVVMNTGYTGRCWHTDFAFSINPPRYTFLLCRKAPIQGGETLFIDTTRVYKKLPAKTRAMLDQWIGIFSFSQVFSRKLKARGEVLNENQQVPDTEHGIVRAHSQTGEKALHLHEEYLIAIKGYSWHESKTMINELYQLVFCNSFITRYQWHVNDMAVWDNRALLHKGCSCPEYCERELHRVIVQ